METIEIFSKQIKIISILRSLIKKNEKKKNFIILKEFYYSSWSYCLGYLKIKELFYQKNLMFKIKIFLSNIYLQFLFSDLKKIQIKDLKKKNFNKVVLSWCYKNDFKKNIYYDRYFSSNSKLENNTLWLLISMDGYFTNHIDNVIIFKNRVSFISFIKFMIISFIKSLINFNLNNFFILENFYIKTENTISKILSIIKVKNFVLPYEGQIFQNYILSNVNKKTSVETIGYIHSALPPLPSEYIKRQGSPQKIIVHGNLQKKILYKYLGWSKKEIFSKRSARYKHQNKKNFKNKIFLPMTFEDKNLLIIYLENFLKKQKKNSLHPFKIKNHPLMNNSEKHLRFIQNINQLFKKYYFKFFKKNKNKESKSIFFSATASIIETLEYGIDVIHIVNDPLLEVHNPKIWKFIETKKIDENIYSYKLKKKSSYISFQDKNFKFSEWIKI